MANFPFQRAKPLGWMINEPLTSAQMNLIDTNAAQAADGTLWTDVAQFRNWTNPVTVLQAGMTVCYVPVSDTWWVSTVSGGSMVTSRMYGGGGAFVGGVSSPTAGILNIEPRAVAFDPVNNYLVYGCTPTTSSNVKYRRSLQTGINAFTAHNSTQTNTSGPKCMAWAGGAINMLISGHFTTGVVETSSDGGATWVNRTVPNADGRLSIAYGGAIATPSIVITSDTAQNRLIQSTDGINWAQRALPASKIWSVVYVPHFGKFLAIADDMSAIASSTDGITWASIGAFSLPTAIGALVGGNDSVFVASGRNVFGVVLSSSTFLVYSQDCGVTWKVAASLVGAGSIGHLGSSGRQLLYTIGTNVQWSVAGGF